jgi:hypothetical protein
MNNCFKGLSLFFIIIFNAIISAIDLFILIISIILLADNNHNFGDIIAVVFLIYGIIILPFVCCGICLVFTLFRINKNNILTARILGTFNILLMIVILVLNIHSSTFFNKGGFVLVIFNILCIVSLIFLCFNKMGYKEPEEPQNPQDIVMTIPRSINEEYYYNGNPEDINIQSDRVEIDIVESTDDEYYRESMDKLHENRKRRNEIKLRNERPSAPTMEELHYPKLYNDELFEIEEVNMKDIDVEEIEIIEIEGEGQVTLR